MASGKIIGNKIYHLVFWLAIAAVWFYLRYQDYANLLQAALVTVVKVADLALVVYFANLVLVPAFLYKKKYGAFVLSFIGAVAATSFLKFLILSAVFSVPSHGTVKEAIYNNFVTQFFLVLASIALRSAFDYIRLQKHLAEMAKEKAEAELAFLKAQMDPHFLFNSLNAVYFLIDKQNTEARDALHKFSEMLRYQLYECTDDRIPIEKEIGFLKDYVGLQGLRTNGNTAVRFACDENLGRFSIEPLLLIQFVENSFKHLSHFSEGRQNEVRINLSRQNGSLLFSVYNTTEGKVAGNGSGGIGLANVQKRLNLLYPNAHQLKLNESDGWFGVELQLSLPH